MRILVTGSTGHLGEALVRTLRAANHDVRGIDILPSAHTDRVGSVSDRAFVMAAMAGMDAVIHSATLHKPHVATHTKQDFIDTNVTGTLTLLECAAECGANRFIFTSTTSAFGAALSPEDGMPAAWITEEVRPIPKNIYGTTKTAAEDLCALFHRKHGLSCLVLRTARFFPEEDDNKDVRAVYDDTNAKINEFLFRRVDLEDVVSAHLCALDKAPALGFGRYIISATSPFTREDLADLRRDAANTVRRYVGFDACFDKFGWSMFPSIDRVYVNERARSALGWRPRFDFHRVLEQADRGEPIGSGLARLIGKKGYHPVAFEDGPYPVE